MRVLAGLADDREHVDVALAFRRDDLLGLNALQRRELIANLRRALELQLRGGLLHARLQLRVHFAAAAFEHFDGGRHVLRVRLVRDEADARRRAAADLVLQARPAAIGEERVAAIADVEQLLQLLQRLLHRAGVRETARRSGPGSLRAPR